MRYEEFESLVNLEIVQKEEEGFEVSKARKAFAARKQETFYLSGTR